MENSQPLATESFSYSWLIDRKPSSSDDDIFLNNLRQTFPNDSEHNFNFDVPVSSSSPSLVHADEIFSDGHIMPVYIGRSNSETLKVSTSVPPSPLYSRKENLGKWRKSYVKILQKCFFGFLRPLCKKIERSRKSNRVDDLERKVCEVRSWSNSVEASPRPSSAYSVVEWRDFKKIGVSNGFKKVKSCNNTPKASPCVSPSRYSSNWCGDESSIHEAILYCKRSIEK